VGHRIDSAVKTPQKTFYPPAFLCNSIRNNAGPLKSRTPRSIEQAMNAKRSSLTEIKRRLEVIREMWRKILPKLEKETGMTQDQLSKYYVTEILGQTCFKD
jgi:hypothetical protein